MSNQVTFGDVEFVEDGIYLGSNDVEYQFKNGCLLVKTPVDIDTNTQDGYSLPGIAPLDVVDAATGEPILPGAPVTVFFDANGDIAGYKDCTEIDTFGVLMTADSSFTDSAGNTVAAGDQYILNADGTTVCAEKTVDTDTFASLIFAGAPGTDDAGNAYIAGDALIQLANGDLVCVDKTIDTNDGFALQGISGATASDIDFNGDTIPAGAPVIRFYDSSGQFINAKDCTDIDTFGILVDAAVSGTDDAGNPYSAGDQLIQLADGNFICAEKTQDTDTFAELIVAAGSGIDDAGNDYAAGDSLIMLANGDIVCVEKTIDTDTVDGYAVQGFSAGGDSDVDINGATIPAGAPVIRFYDANGQFLNAKDCTDEFGVIMTADSAFVDSAGNDVAVGDQYIQLADGSTACQEKTVDTVDGYATLGFANASTVDIEGNPIPVGAEVINFYDPSGNLEYSKDCTDDDTFGVPKSAEAAGTDAFGNAFAAGANVIEFPGGLFVCMPMRSTYLDYSDPCFIVERDSKTNLTVGQFRKDTIEFNSGGIAQNFISTAEVNEIPAAGGELLYEVCKTYANPNPCRNFVVTIDNKLSGWSFAQVPVGWFGTVFLEQSIDGGAYQILDSELFDTRQNSGPENVSIGGLNDSNAIAVPAGGSIDVCLRVRFDVQGAGGPIPFSQVGGLKSNCFGNAQ